jgi:RNA-directed DNA polymerase
MSTRRPNNQLTLSFAYGVAQLQKAFTTKRSGEAAGARRQGVEADRVEEYTERPEPTEQLRELVATSDELMELICQPANIEAATRRVCSNKGAPGVDGMTVGELPKLLERRWSEIVQQLLSGTYQPQPVRVVEIEKPGGGTRRLGIPTVLDRMIQQAMLQVLSPVWDQTFHDNSFGFRPGRSAHQAIDRAQQYVNEGNHVVVDIDLEQFFDRVNHDVLMSRVARRIRDKRVLKLIRGYLTAGMMEGGMVSPRAVGTPQGGPLSPLLSNLLLDELDQELQQRGHRFVRYADDCNIYVRSQRSGERVMETVEKFLRKRLRLKINHGKSAVADVRQRSFLGFGFLTTRTGYRRTIGPKALKRFRQRIRDLTKRHGGRSLKRTVVELTRYLRGWLGYFGHSEDPLRMRDLDGWIRRRLRAVHWKQWKTKRRRYRQLRQLGARATPAYEAIQKGDRHWHMSRQPVLQRALSLRYFDELGLLRLDRSAVA